VLTHVRFFHGEMDIYILLQKSEHFRYLFAALPSLAGSEQRIYPTEQFLVLDVNLD
jgi:hypothetical protein